MKTKYDFSSNNQITTSIIDGTYLWLAFKGSSGSCKLKKVSVYNPDDVYFDLTITADDITSMWIYSGYLFLSFDDSVYIGAVVSTTAPLTDYSYFAIPTGITEKAIDVIVDISYIYFLTPGLLSGCNAQIAIFSVASPYTWIENVDLTKTGSTITNAKKIDIDAITGGNLWVVTDDAVPILAKAYNSGGWTFDEYTLS